MAGRGKGNRGALREEKREKREGKRCVERVWRGGKIAVLWLRGKESGIKDRLEWLEEGREIERLCVWRKERK